MREDIGDIERLEEPIEIARVVGGAGNLIQSGAMPAGVLRQDDRASTALAAGAVDR